jgi:tripartite-type tricarboxylate transporter receptor subunit TctC
VVIGRHDVVFNSKETPLRTILLLILFAAAPVFCAESYPSKPIRWIVPFPPGGGTDVISRNLSQELTKSWGQQVVADNRPGSGGTIGLAQAARLPPDGYNLVLGQLANVGIGPSLYAKLPYDSLKDFTYITLAVTSPLILVVHPSFPAKSVNELITVARAKPDAVTFGSPGNGTAGHLATELLRLTAKIRMTHVPYKGAAPAFTGLMGGEIAVYMSSIPPALPQLSAGRVRALGVTSAKRMPTLPNVPAIAESLPGFEVTNWYGVMAPAGLPKEILTRLNTELVRIMKQPEVQKRFAGEGDLSPTSPEEFATFARNEVAKWAKVVQESGAKVD